MTIVAIDRRVRRSAGLAVVLVAGWLGVAHGQGRPRAHPREVTMRLGELATRAAAQGRCGAALRMLHAIADSDPDYRDDVALRPDVRACLDAAPAPTGAPADAPVPAPFAQSRPESSPTPPRRYGWQVALSDAASLGILGLTIASARADPDLDGVGPSARTEILALTFPLVYLGGPMIVHLRHGHPAGALASVASRAALPFLAAAASPDGSANYLAGIGVVAAMALDWLVLGSVEDRVHGPRRPMRTHVAVAARAERVLHGGDYGSVGFSIDVDTPAWRDELSWRFRLSAVESSAIVGPAVLDDARVGGDLGVGLLWRRCRRALCGTVGETLAIGPYETLSGARSVAATTFVFEPEIGVEATAGWLVARAAAYTPYRLPTRGSSTVSAGVSLGVGIRF